MNEVGPLERNVGHGDLKGKYIQISQILILVGASPILVIVTLRSNTTSIFYHEPRSVISGADVSLLNYASTNGSILAIVEDGTPD